MKMGRNTLEMGDLNSIPPGKWKDLSADLHLQVSPWTAKLPNKKRRKVLQNDYKKLYVGTPALSTDKDSRFPAHRVTGLEVSWTWYLPYLLASYAAMMMSYVILYLKM